MQYAFHFVPKTSSLKKKKKKGQHTINKVHQFQRVSIRKRPKDSAGTSQKSHPGRPLIVFRKYSIQKRKKGKETSTLKSQEKHTNYTSLETSCKTTLNHLLWDLICPQSLPLSFQHCLPSRFCQARHAVRLKKPRRSP